jgi:hypothetical protein
LTGQFASLAEGSSFRASLAEIEPGALIQALEDAFHPLPLNEHTLPLVLRLSEIEARPELVLPLLPMLDRCDELSDEARLCAAMLAERAGARDAAFRMFAHRAVSHLLRLHREHNWLDPSALEFLVRVDPAKVLLVLRLTRERGVRTLGDEPSGERLFYAARASEALHRPTQAHRLYERALEYLYGDLKAACCAGIRRLSAM